MRATPKIRENPMARRANVLPLMRPLMMMSIMRAILAYRLENNMGIFSPLIGRKELRIRGFKGSSD